MLVLQEKRMKTVLNLTLFALIHFISQSQNLYVRVSTGYNFSAARSNMENYLMNKWVAVVYPYDVGRFQYSLGKGQNINVELGYTTKHNLGFELNFAYLRGVKNIAEDVYVENDIFRKELWGQFYAVNPGVHLLCPLGKAALKMNISGVFGMGNMYFNQIGVFNGEEWMRYENKFSGGYYLGFKAGVDIIYPISNRWSLFLNVNWVNANYSPTKAKTRYMESSIDKTHLLSVWERETVFTNSIEKGQYNPDVPSQRLRENFAASSIGLQVGIQWNLWKQKIEEDKPE